MGCSSCGCNTCSCVGATGPKGLKGDTGDTGATGQPGPTGSQGIQGPSGANGTNGSDGSGYGGFSSTNTNILDTGAVTLSATITTGLAYTNGARIRFSDSANPSVNYFEGVINTYNSATGAVEIIAIDVKEGTGTINSWNVNIAGELGDQGLVGSQGIQGPQGLQGPTGPTGANGADGSDGRGYDSLSSTSTDVLDTAATVVNMTIAANKAYVLGFRVRFADQSDPSVNYFEGVVTAYNTTTGAMTVGSVNVKEGTGTISDWGISIAGDSSVSASVSVFSSYSIAPDQQPVGLGDANKIQVEFGSASAGAFYNLNSNGLLTITQDGRYDVSISLQFGRTGGTSSATLIGRVLVDGVPSEPSIAAKLNNQNTLLPFISRIGPFDFLAGTTISVEIMRFNGANDSGGLFSQSSGEASWADARTAEITLRKY